MKKRTVLGLAVLGTVVASVAAGIKYANMKKALRTGQVDGWIQEVTGGLVPYEIKSTIPVPAYIEDDASKIYFRFSDADLTTLSVTTQSFKDTVQAIAAHEMGHAVDPRLQLMQKRIHTAIRFKDYDTYKRLVLKREEVAWRRGLTYAPNKDFFNKYNKTNMRSYAIQLGLQKGEFK